MKDDMIETKINEVLAELLNRVRGPIEKQNARAEQSIDQLGMAVSELKSEIDALRADTGSIRRGNKPSSEARPLFAEAGIGILLVLVGVFIGWIVKGPSTTSKAKPFSLELPKNARVTSQQLENDRLLVKFTGSDGKQRLAIFRLEDGGKVFAILDIPTGGNKPDATVP